MPVLALIARKAPALSIENNVSSNTWVDESFGSLWVPEYVTTLGLECSGSDIKWLASVTSPSPSRSLTSTPNIHDVRPWRTVSISAWLEYKDSSIPYNRLEMAVLERSDETVLSSVFRLILESEASPATV